MDELPVRTQSANSPDCCLFFRGRSQELLPLSAFLRSPVDEMFEQPSTRAKPIGRECWAQSTRPPLDLLDYFRSENARHAREAYVTREGKGTIKQVRSCTQHHMPVWTLEVAEIVPASTTVSTINP
jgi:hypothetical protein